MVKDELIHILKQNKGKYISGQALCKRLNVSRTAIWKYINELKEEGYTIDSQHKAGYMLTCEPDILSYIEVLPYLSTSFIGRNYIYKASIRSTNDMAKDIAGNVQNGTVIIAEEQTSGRGRLGRTWISPKGCGIWMSIILKPNLKPQDAVKLTQVAAVSVVSSIIEVANMDAGIKWPNDIIINGKKVCGILTEMNSEIDKINYVVIGIGLNANCSEFPDDLKDKATSLYLERGAKIDRKLLTAGILNHFEKYYNKYLEEGFGFIRTLCIEKSVTIGKQIRVVSTDGELTGQAVDIDSDGNLIVKTPIGENTVIISGDVSVRGILGYV